MHRMSYPYTPSQNGVVKRRNIQVLEKSLAMHMMSNVPMSHWDYGFQIVGNLINCLPSKIFNYINSIELFFSF